jgi:nicotinamidase/pyrazinamidase
MMSLISLPIDFRKDTLLAVDVQPTFMPGGGLAVEEGDQIVRLVADLAQKFQPRLRVATRDLHPPGHISLASSYVGLAPFTALAFEEAARWGPDSGHLAPHALFTMPELQSYLHQVGQQVLWPDHAVAGTDESDFHPYLKQSGLFPFVFNKGLDPKCDSYSAFRDNLKKPTHLAEYMRALGCQRVWIVGLAFDYCVGWTALDAKAEGFEPIVISGGTRPVAADSAKAMAEQLKAADIRVM